jgi:purine nucleosidase
MSKLRRFIIDTDTGSDDVWAIIEALRATDIVRVEAVTVLCGNLPLDMCVKNAMLAVDAAGTYTPPVYRGMDRPLMHKESFYAVNVHGDDGLGGMHLPPSPRPVETKHAVDAIIDIVMANPGEIEICTIGPLTNIAMAVLKEPKLAENVKKVWILGGSAGPTGNMTPAAEYNVYVDPEAASIVLDAGMDTMWVTWDNARGETEITPEEVNSLLSCGDSTAEFCAKCTRRLREYYHELYGRDTYGVIDSLLMTCALYPEIMRNTFRANCAIELRGTETRGYFRIDRDGRLKKEPNAEICPAVDVDMYKQKLFALFGVQR